MVAAVVAAVASVLLVERFVDDATILGASSAGGYGVDGSSGSYAGGGGLGVGGEGGGRDCNVEWCLSRSVLGLWEWALLLLEAGFCMALKHDLAPATSGVGVESFVL